MNYAVTWEDDVVMRGERAVIIDGSERFQTAAVAYDCLTPACRREWEFLLRDELRKLRDKRRNDFVKADITKPVWTLPGRL